MTTITAPAKALDVVQAIYHAMRAHTEVGQLPDGTQLLEFPNGWVFRIFDDPDEYAPNGISWWLDAPDRETMGIGRDESDGWESLTLTDLDGIQITGLAGYLDSVAQRKCEANDGER